MRLSDGEVAVKRKPRRSTKNPTGYYNDAHKLDLAKPFIMLGENLSMAARTVGVPWRTAQSWKKTQWWTNLYEQCKGQETLELSTRLQKVLAKSLDLVEDRLEHGDFMYDPRTGKLIRKEVNLRDAHIVFKDTLDIKQAMERAPQEAKTQQTIQETLASLAKNFEELASKQRDKPKVEVTDVIFIKDESDT